MFDEGLHRLEHTGAQAGFVGAAGDGGNQIDVGLGGHALGEPAEGPGGSLAGGEIGFLGRHVFFSGENRCHRLLIAGQLTQVASEAFRIAPGLGQHATRGLFDVQRHLDAGQQHGLGAQQAFQLVERHLGRIEILAIGPDADAGAALATAAAQLVEGADVFTALAELDAPDLALAPHFDGHLGGQRVGHRDAHTVQAAGEGIGRIATLLVELATGMQPRVGQHHHGDLLFRMQADGDAATVVGHRHRAILMQHDMDVLGKAAEGFVRRVVDDFLDDVGR